jgi:hypothetical protein
MKNVISFIIILFFICLAGVVWGVYEFQTAHGMETSQTLAIIRSYLGIRPPKPPPEKPAVVKKPPENKPAEVLEKPIHEEAPFITPVVEAPVAPPKVDLRRAPKIEKPNVNAEAQILVDDGNKYYDQGIIHLQNTFKKDKTFDKENELAIENFRTALAKYLEAENIDPDSLWLRNRIRETNSNLVTCRKQARRK